jgi:thioredoxin-related protein
MTLPGRPGSPPPTRFFVTKRIALAALGIMVFALSAVFPARAAVTWRGWDAGLSESGKSGRPVLVDVYTDWCGWCKRMDRDVYARSEVQDYLSRKFVVVKLNAEGNESVKYQGKGYTARTLAAFFGVTGYPTTIFLSGKGAHLGNVPGYIPPDRFLLLLRFIGDGHAEKGESFDEFARAEAARH